MALELPKDIPVAVAHSQLLSAYGKIVPIPKVQASDAFVFIETVETEPCVWSRVEYRYYRSAWAKAAAAGLVSPLSDWGEDIDVDHVVARSVARARGLNTWFLRLFPAYREVNRGAGASREKYTAGNDVLAINGDVVFANELQILKIIGHPVGTTGEPTNIFDS